MPLVLRPPLRWFYLSCLAAFTGGHVVNYTLILYAQEAIGSDLLSGIGFGLAFGPPVVLGWVAGVWCDRLAPGRLIHAAQAVFVLAAALLWAADAATAATAPRVAALVVAAALTGVGWSFVSPARMATLGQIASADEIKPASVIFNLLVMVGFGLGPLVLALARSRLGWPGVFAAAIALFALASLALLPVRTRTSARVHEPVAVEIRQGVAAVRADALLAQLMVAAMVGYLAMGPLTVLLPKLAATRLALSEVQRGSFLGALALALIAGGLVALALAPRAHHGRTILAGTALAGVWLAALGLVHSASWALLLLAGVGVAGGLALSLIVAGIQARSPAALRGRVVSMYTVISQVVPAASGVVAGALVQGFGVGTALVACGATLALAMLVNARWMGALRAHRG